MGADDFVREVSEWIAGDDRRKEILIRKTPVKANTLRQFLSGRYVPSERLQNAIRAVMGQHSKVSPAPKAAAS